MGIDVAGAGQAASLYLLAYYGGASLAGTVAGWSVVERGLGPGRQRAGGLMVAALVVSLALMRTRRLPPPSEGTAVEPG